MTQFIITYIGGNPPSTPKEGKAHFAKYKEWLNSLGEKAVSPMNPFKNTHTIESNGNLKNSGNTQMSGFTIIEAENMENALELSKSCPFLEIGGSLEISELVKM